MIEDFAVRFTHSHKKQVVWKHGSSEQKSLCYVEIYRTAQKPGMTFKKTVLSLKGISSFAGEFVLI